LLLVNIDLFNDTIVLSFTFSYEYLKQMHFAKKIEFSLLAYN